jgi:hypothetical protein
LVAGDECAEDNGTVAGKKSHLREELHQCPEELLRSGIRNARASAAHHVR